MRTKTIGRWRRAALAGLMSATLGARAQQKTPGQDAAAKPAAAQAPQSDATSAPPADDTKAPQPADAKPAAGAAAPADTDDGPASAAPGSSARSAGPESSARPAAPESSARPAAPESSRLAVPPGTPPLQIAPGTPDEYTVQKGDTLWDLSQKFLSNPWYWPKIWSLNPAIENPHWIYPGNRLKIIPGEGGAQAPAQVQADASAGEEQQGVAPTEVTESDLPPPPTGGDLEVVSRTGREARAASNAVSVSGKLTFTPPPVLKVRTTGLVSPDEVDSAGTLDASFEEKEMLANYDTAYVRFRHEVPVKAGDKLVLFRPDGNVTHPITHRKLAEKTKNVAVAKVLSVKGQLATVQIETTYEEVARGDLARPWTPQDKRIAPKPNLQDVSGVIVSALNPGLTTFGEAHEVFIDRGTADGVQEGNTFAVVRKGDGLSNVLVTQSYAQGDQGTKSAKTTVPDENVGLLLVVDAREHLSTAVVVKSIRELQAGDSVEMRTAGAGGP